MTLQTFKEFLNEIDEINLNDDTELDEELLNEKNVLYRTIAVALKSKVSSLRTSVRSTNEPTQKLNLIADMINASSNITF